MTKGQRNMTDYKLVPVEPTPEMIDAGRSQSSFPLGVYKAMLAAAPEVQVEPAAYMFADDWGRTKIVLGKETAEHWAPPGGTIEPLYAAPQPAPDVAGLVEALEWLRGAINCTPENDKHRSGAWISTKHPRIRQIDELLAAHRKQGGDT